jgi:serine protease AprX
MSHKKYISVFIIIFILGLTVSTGFGATLDEVKSKLGPLVQKLVTETPDQVIPLIVQTYGVTDTAKQTVSLLGGKVTSDLWLVKGFGAEIKASDIVTLAADPNVRAITFDGPVLPLGIIEETSKLASMYPKVVNAPDVWNHNYKGKGIGVAVVDSGLSAQSSPDINDLHKRVTADVHLNAANGLDYHGHGTHVAGIIAGDGNASNGKYVGIAPKANIINAKVADGNGLAKESYLINGLQWIYKNKDTHNIRVVNISSAAAIPQSYMISPISAAVEQLWFNGIVIVVSSGNKGSSADAVMHPPANDPYVISVGAIDDKGTTDRGDDEVTSWSSRGKTLDNVQKPDIVAPGRHITSLLSPDGWLGANYPNYIVDSHYFWMNGTSMAAPVVSGTVALMLEARPELTPDEVKWILMNTSTEFGTVDRTQSDFAGLVDTKSAALFSGTPGKANQGLTPALNIDPLKLVFDYSGLSWDHMTWNTYTIEDFDWNHMTWDHMTWNHMTWNHMTWQ